MARGKKHGEIDFRLPEIRTFQMVQYLTGWPTTFPEDGIGTMDDLPTNLQDTIYKAMEKLSLAKGLPLAVVLVRMDVDLDRRENDTRGYVFLQVILSEVVMLDTAKLMVEHMIATQRTLH